MLIGDTSEMVLIFFILAVFYGLIIFYFYIGLLQLSTKYREDQLTVTVLVPARNEEENILNCLVSLDAQTYPKNLYNIIVIDDNSKDNTAGIVKKYIANKDNFKLLQNKTSIGRKTYKKQALKYAMNEVSSDIVMTIDADSTTNPHWIEKMIAQYDEQTGLVAGLVTFPEKCEKGTFHKIQTLEFAGIVFAGVGSMANHSPLICNGSNLSYRLRAFKEAGGYEDNLHLPSGDDDLFLQNLHHKTGWKVKYSIDPQTINYTQPVKNFRAFLNQRARWASKSLDYPQKWIFFVMVGLYLFYLSLFIFSILTILGIFPLIWFLIVLLLKIIPEALVISKALRILNRKDLWKYFLPAQIFQIAYILIVGILGLMKHYRWKE